jgi:parallel beta-helix repeat protein
LTGNITSDADGIVVERSNIIIDGNGYTLQGTGAYASKGIDLSSRSNVTSKNTNIKDFSYGILLSESSNISIIGNNVTSNRWGGIGLWGASNNTISGNHITNNGYGIDLDKSSDNSISGNNITANNNYGIFLGWSSNNNSISGNNITANNAYGIRFYDESSNNVIFHNNFIDNVNQVWPYGYLNHWDDGYPSGGNYWSDYTGIDIKKGADQNQTGSDGIGDTPHIIDENNQDRYPLMIPWPWPEHELVVSITTPASLQLGSSSSLDAIVTNQGLNDEVNVVLSLFINGTKTNSTTIPLLQPWNSYSLSYLWTPTVKGTYNITAYATPVPGETSVENNQETASIRVVQVGVKAGDWIKYDYTVTGWPAGTPYPKWLKVEFLGVEGTNATIRVTMHMSDGTEQNATLPVDVVAGGQAFGLSGFVIPANLTTGDIIFMSGYGNVTIAGKTTRNYAGASRTVVYASFSQYGTQLTYYWDKRTGVMVEASVTSGTMTGTGKATETNMWEAAPAFPIDPLILAALIAIVVGIVVAVFLVRRKKKPTEAQRPETSS